MAGYLSNENLIAREWLLTGPFRGKRNGGDDICAVALCWKSALNLSN